MSKTLIEQLVVKLNEATKAYDEGHPTMSDKEWDDLYFRLDFLEKATGVVLENSPTRRVIYEVVNQLNKVEHDHQMLSLEKTKDMAVVKSMFDNSNQGYLMMAKMDGLTCSLRYENGRLVKAETRGNGLVGEDILHNARVIPSIPNYIAYKDETLVIDGEIICTYDDFIHFENDYKNPRNFAAGSIRLLDNKECESRRLQFVAWDVIEGFDGEDSLYNKLNFIEALGFTVVPRIFKSSDIEEMQRICKEKSYPIDGVVFKFTSAKYSKTLGQTAHHFKNAIAYKFYDETYPTVLKDIEWTMGRTGVLTPVAIFDPLDIEGSTVERASLHNITILEQTLGKHPYIGQKIEVFKANMIIPQISWADTSLNHSSSCCFLIEPDVCPICGEPVHRVTEVDSTNLICDNPNCAGKLINRLDHFCGKKGLDIKGLSKATLEKLIDWGWVNNISDIMILSQYRNDWIKKAGFGVRSVDKVLDSIETAKHTTLDKFISSLGIPLIGTTVSKELVKYFSSYEDFRLKVREQYNFATIDGFADSKTESLLNFDYTEADKVYTYLVFEDNNNDTELADNYNNLEGITFVVTGKLNTYKNRAALQLDIENRGGKVVGSVSANTKYLINNDNTSTSAKNMAAKKLNIPILTEQEFIEKFLK